MKITFKKLTVTLSPRNRGIQIRYAMPRRVINGLTYYDFTWSLHLLKPEWRLPRFKRDDNSWLPISCILQDTMLVCGIAACNLFRHECTSGFECCAWNVCDEDREVLKSIASNSPLKPSGLYVAKAHEGTCRCCGKLEDLREGVCFDCADHVVVEDLVEGVTSFHDTKGEQTWVP